MPKPPGQALRTGASCAAFRAHLAALRTQQPVPSSWMNVQQEFLRSMEGFDDLVIAGQASEGERQNGKGDYFNDLLAVVLENASGVPLNRRNGVPGLIFPNHNLDVTYPQNGTIVEVLVEAKMLGTPQHPGNVTSQKLQGRDGAADILKRAKEAGFKTIDLKAAYGMQQTAAGLEQQQGIAGDLTSWLRTAKPKSYLVAGIRVTSNRDRQAVLAVAQSMTQVMDGVGLFLYAPKGFRDTSLSPAQYESVPVPSQFEMYRVLHRISLDLLAASSRQATTPALPPAPAAAVASALSAAGMVDEAEDSASE